MNIVQAIRNALAPSSAPSVQGTASGAVVTASSGNGGSTGNRSDETEVAALKPKSKGKRLPRPYERYAQISPSTLAVSNAIKLSGGTVVTAAERDRLVELDEEYQRLQDFANDLTSDGARRAYYAQQANHQQRLAAGKGDELKAEDSWTIEEFETDFRAKSQAAHEEMRRLVGEASPITARIRDRIGEVAIKATAELEREERERADSWGMPFVPSNILIAIGRLSWNLEWIPVCNPGMTAPRPKEILSVIDALPNGPYPRRFQ